MSVFIGIDPGQDGGIAVISACNAAAWRYPGDIDSAAKLINDLEFEHGGFGLACLEKVSAMPKQGVSSTFKFGMNFGAWQGILAAFRIPYITVTPRQWQKSLLDAGTGETKERSLSMARRLFPDVDLRFRADDGKADALHLARFAARQYAREGNMTADEWKAMQEAVEGAE